MVAEGTFTAILPPAMSRETDEGAADYWRAQAVDAGWVPTADPTVERLDPFMVEDEDGSTRPLFPGVDVLVRVEGPVVAAEAMGPLPKAYPDWLSVEAAAARLAASTGGGRDWDQLPDAVQTYYAHLAEAMLTAAMPELTALILEHVAEHPTGFMLTPDEQDAIEDVAELARAEVQPFGG